MDRNRLKERKKDFQAAVARLDEACRLPADPIVRDSVIQRFTFCWELAWKTLNIWLNYLGVDVQNPRDTFREAYNAGLIADGNLWSDMQKMRNLTSHTYNEQLAEEVYSFIRETGLDLFTALAEKSRTWTIDD